MIAKEITYKQLKEAIIISFNQDNDIIALYDPNILVNTIEEVQNDIYRKLKEFESMDQISIKGIYEKGEIIGYYFRRNGLLISFALACAFRTRSFLRQFFSLIKKDFQGCFMCYLWNKNERGIRWLLKNGMQVHHRDNHITQLIIG